MNPLTTLLSRFRDLTARQQATLGGGVIMLMVVAFLLFSLATRTAWSTVTTGLQPADAPEIAQALSAAGVENRIAQGGTAIQVPEPDLDRARAAVATSQVGAAGGSVGFELFDKTNLGATDFQQRIQYQRALEGEIARTIQAIDGVRSAQVQLVLPKDQLFTDEGNPASASVLLQTKGAPLEAAQVAGIARLVQSSVEGLKLPNITITDQSGGLLWPTPKVSNPDGQSATDQQAAEERYASNLSARLNSLLVQTIGPGKAQAQVTADLNVDKQSREELAYGPACLRSKDNCPGIPLTEKTKTEKLRGNGSVQRPSGTDGNIPSYGTTGNAGNTRYDNTDNETTYGVDKTVTKTEVAPGEVKRLQVAVLLDRSISAADEASLRQTLAAAAGIVPARGDQLAVSRVGFTKPAPADTEQGGPLPGGSVGQLIRYGLLGLALMLFAFFAWRGLRRREGETLDLEPVWLDSLGLDQDTEVLPPRPPAVMPERQKLAAQEQVESLADKEPEQMAHQVRTWMSED